MIAIVGVLERIRKKLFLFLLLLSCIIFLHRFSRFKDETEVDVNSKTFLFENCSCNRTVFDIEENKTNSVKFSQTTCGREAFEKGSNQKASLSTGTVHLKLTRLENISLGSRRNMGGEISEKLDEVFFFIFFFSQYLLQKSEMMTKNYNQIFRWFISLCIIISLVLLCVRYQPGINFIIIINILKSSQEREGPC